MASLERRGFSRFRKGHVDFALGENFACWVGLNEAIFADYVEINPFVGVHVPPIMKMYTSLEGRKYDRSIATYAVHLGELAPDEQAFHFRKDTALDREADRLAALYAGVGLDYARSISSYEALLPLLEGRVGMLGGYPERFACCLVLLNRVEDARRFVTSFLREEGDYFSSFAEPFLAHLKHVSN